MRNEATLAYIGIGSNLGDRARYCYNAVQQLSLIEHTRVLRISPLIETAPVGGPAGSPPFLNGALSVETTLGAHAFWREMLAIEHRLGRERREKWEPRTVDLDLLLFGEKIISSDDLIVPHPMMHQRRFVLEPLGMVAPDAVHPALQMTISGLLDNLKEPSAFV
ncbi:MAG TPA: 2-amino-4-hydroxy-6-hydroxymethyldihydropteridine diphosphokinase [Tepidisphaeraceae bacterium]|jgi:2-amino-4-hydroxy-6-hydroxymethyldihydropteridine diphosphokinase